MKGTLTARIGWRYLRAGKSHGPAGAISLVSVVGVAVATAAIVCVLSVFNGFRGIISDRLDTLSPDIMVTPASGKVFVSADSLAEVASRVEGVASATPTLTDNALVIYGSREMPVRLKGVTPRAYRRLMPVDSLMLEGGRFIEATEGGSGEIVDFDPVTGEPVYDFRGALGEAALSIGASAQLGYFQPGEPLLVFAPRREGKVNTANLAAAFVTDSVAGTGVFRTDQSDYDNDLVFCDIDLARRLFQYSDEASALEIAVKAGADPVKTAGRLSTVLGPGFIVKDRMAQQEMNFRMVNIEKWVSYLLLFFILVIASFNIVSSMSMVVLEKRRSMSVLLSLGMSRRGVGNVFWWESMYVSLLGGVAGLVLGVALCILQERFGLVRMAGDPEELIVTAYPVVLEWRDVLIAAIPVVVIGLATAMVSSSFARSRATVSAEG